MFIFIVISAKLYSCVITAWLKIINVKHVLGRAWSPSRLTCAWSFGWGYIRDEGSGWGGWCLGGKGKRRCARAVLLLLKLNPGLPKCLVWLRGQSFVRALRCPFQSTWNAIHRSACPPLRLRVNGVLHLHARSGQYRAEMEAHDYRLLLQEFESLGKFISAFRFPQRYTS